MTKLRIGIQRPYTPVLWQGIITTEVSMSAYLQLRTHIH